jgi:hypothetical protein
MAQAMFAAAVAKLDHQGWSGDPAVVRIAEDVGR